MGQRSELLLLPGLLSAMSTSSPANEQSSSPQREYVLEAIEGEHRTEVLRLLEHAIHYCGDGKAYSSREVRQLVTLNDAAIPQCLNIMADGDRESRAIVEVVLRMILGDHIDSARVIWPTPHDELSDSLDPQLLADAKRDYAFQGIWEYLGGLDANAAREQRLKSVAKWRQWLVRRYTGLR